MLSRKPFPKRKGVRARVAMLRLAAHKAWTIATAFVQQALFQSLMTRMMPMLKMMMAVSAVNFICSNTL